MRMNCNDSARAITQTLYLPEKIAGVGGGKISGRKKARR